MQHFCCKLSEKTQEYKKKENEPLPILFSTLFLKTIYLRTPNFNLLTKNYSSHFIFYRLQNYRYFFRETLNYVAITIIFRSYCRIIQFYNL